MECGALGMVVPGSGLGWSICVTICGVSVIWRGKLGLYRASYVKGVQNEGEVCARACQRVEFGPKMTGLNKILRKNLHLGDMNFKICNL